jgi:hypothetical protein
MAKPHCCSLWLSQAYIGALPSHASRHDSPCRPHSLTALLSTVMSGQDATVLVSTDFMVIVLLASQPLSVIQ